MSKRVFEEIAPKKSKEESEDEEENKETCPPDPVLAFILAPSEQIHECLQLSGSVVPVGVTTVGVSNEGTLTPTSIDKKFYFNEQ